MAETNKFLIFTISTFQFLIFYDYFKLIVCLVYLEESVFFSSQFYLYNNNKVFIFMHYCIISTILVNC